MKNYETELKNELEPGQTEATPATVADVLETAIMTPDFNQQGHPIGLTTDALVARRKLVKKVQAFDTDADIDLKSDDWTAIKSHFKAARWPNSMKHADVIAAIAEALEAV